MTNYLNQLIQPIDIKYNQTKQRDIRTNLDPKIWGGAGWIFSDAICLSYPTNPTEYEKEQYKNLFYAYPIVLPCTKCRYHFEQYLEQNPLDDSILSSKDKLIKWILGARNNVSKINGTKQIKLEEFYNYYNAKFKMDVRNDTCTNKCGLKNKSSSVYPIYAYPNPNHNQTTAFDYKLISIILFGIIIALSLYLIRTNQLYIRNN